MDITLMRIVVTVISFMVFLGICWWALLPANRGRFEEAANLPFDDEHKGETK